MQELRVDLLRASAFTGSYRDVSTTGLTAQGALHPLETVKHHLKPNRQRSVGVGQVGAVVNPNRWPASTHRVRDSYSSGFGHLPRSFFDG
jgi:hypothetical protein